MRDVIILCGGGCSSERDVSLRSGKMVFDSLSKTFNSELVILDKDELPASVTARRDAIIFPIIHGKFGEDGELQILMEEAGLCYVGSDSKASSLCMDKFSTKQVVSKAGVPVALGAKFAVKNGRAIGLGNGLLGEDCVVKPNDSGSSLNVKKINSRNFDHEVSSVPDGDFLLEKNIIGKDLTVGVLDGKVLEIVEILPKEGFFDYHNKYTPGASEEICPARISREITEKIKYYTEQAYEACGCRDWARIDFMLEKNENIFFLEVNTVPGMTETSLYPQSAGGCKISYDDLLIKLVGLANKRFR